jgi:hypothetical protein
MVAVAKDYSSPRKPKACDKIENVCKPVRVLNKVVAIRMLADDVEAICPPAWCNV